MKVSKADQEQAMKYLKKLFAKRKDKTVYTIVTHVSKSGMFRLIRAYMMHKGKPLDITPEVGNALGWGNDERWGVPVSGCGMDMTFHMVYTLSQRLYPDKERGGYILKNAHL